MIGAPFSTPSIRVPCAILATLPLWVVLGHVSRAHVLAAIAVQLVWIGVACVVTPLVAWVNRVRSTRDALPTDRTKVAHRREHVVDAGVIAGEA